ncbi:zinc-dependent metalloprotease [Chitinophaga nivalis]|uniref:Zinc-dependent metalloprotease n=1 Tax=Chitinophaga nivalis TaxID=2991709 RepID=A0ABT3IQD9_9BACT|nr:zinc-dependent metalloprotease [Chitinophaga nivalis]MCW3464108.1 zinc-dependent metalloprotease [Chitinophaga nivalis]MCW3486202.1 zinc-dependent metalloprotease [Chitinophaga nivalis]
MKVLIASLICSVFYCNIIYASCHSLRQINLIKKENGYCLEISNDVLGRDLIIVCRISNSAYNDSNASMKCYGGDKVNEGVFRLDKGPNNTVELKSLSFNVIASNSSDEGMNKSLNNSSSYPIIAVFKILSNNKSTGDKESLVLDVNEFISSDNDFLFMSRETRSALKIGAFQKDKSYINYIHSLDDCVDINFTQTFSKNEGGFLTYELHTTIMLLPDIPMKPRLADNRIGFFTHDVVDLDGKLGASNLKMITRWKLEINPLDSGKYKRGILVEPKHPIIFYIDPATPSKWVPYLIKGVNDWQAAFESAGFKNAILGKIAPSQFEDSVWSIFSSRRSAIVWQASENTGGTYTTVVDPRSGEIIESHIRLGPSIGRQLRNWYFTQSSPSDSRARAIFFDDDLMGQLLRYLCAHEVGHTLGLQHNMLASSMFPTDSLRSADWVHKNGFCSSIMDYARFNYVAQPEDCIQSDDLFPRVNYYDKWAIEWGYRIVDVKEDEELVLKQLTLTKWKEKKYWGISEDTKDSRAQNEDLSDDPIKASLLGIKNLQFVLTNLLEWAGKNRCEYFEIKDIYDWINKQFGYYTSHVANYVGGIYDEKIVPDRIIDEKFKSKSFHQKMLKFFDDQVFTSPTWLLNDSVLKITGDDKISIIKMAQVGVLYMILSAQTISNLTKNEKSNGKDTYSVSNLYTDLRLSIWKEIYSHRLFDVYRMNLQTAFIDYNERLLLDKELSLSERLVVTEELELLLLDIQKSLPFYKDHFSINYLKRMTIRLKKIISIDSI